MRTYAAAALAVATLAGIAVCPSLAVSAETGKGDPRSCSALLVSADKSTDRDTARRKVFRATRILDVRVRAVVPASVEFKSDDLVAFRFTTPKGNLYQTIEVPVGSPVQPGEKERIRPGYPFPLEVQQPKGVTMNGVAARSIEARLPVGGTAIMESGLYGLWRVEALVGGARPCSAEFELQP